MRSTLAVVMLCACSPGTGPTDAGGTGGGSGTAEMCTFMGGKTGAVGCAFQSAAWDNAGGRTTIKVGTAMGASPSVAAQFVITSKPMVASYSGGMAGTECTITINDGAKGWTADTTMSLGACALNLRTVRPGTAADTFDLHGGLSASVEPDDGMGGTVTLTSSF